MASRPAKLQIELLASVGESEEQLTKLRLRTSPAQVCFVPFPLLHISTTQQELTCSALLLICPILTVPLSIASP